MNNSERLDAIIAKAIFHASTNMTPMMYPEQIETFTRAVRDALLAEGRVLYEGDACKASLVIPLDEPVVSPRPNPEVSS